MTSNIGARYIQKRAAVGFQSSAQSVTDKIEEQVLSEVKKTFAPEFINRLDEIIIFDQLSDADLIKIIDLQIERLNQILASRSMQIRLTEPVKKWLVEKTCADRNYGARPLKRALQKYVEDELSEKLIQGAISEENLIEVFMEKGKLAFRMQPLINLETELILEGE